MVEPARAGDPLILSFGAPGLPAGGGFGFVGRLRKLEGLLGRRFHRIHVRDPLQAWYLRGVAGLGADVAGTASALATVIDELRPSRVVTLGQAMGGYGAILFGRLLRADRVVAFGAPSKPGPADVPDGGMQGLAQLRSLADDGLLGPASDLAAAPARSIDAPQLRLHYGTRSDASADESENIDLLHARRFSALPGCRVTLHADAARGLVDHLRRAHELDALLLRELFEIDPARVHRRARPVLDDGWLQWIAENLLLDCSPESLISVMTANDIDPISARSALAEVEREPSYRAARSFASLAKKYESVLINQQRTSELHGHADRIERRHAVGREEFLDRHVAASRPLVLTGVMDDWPARHLWSPQHLKARYGEAQVQVQMARASDPRYEIRADAHRREVRLADYVDLVQAGASNDHYLTANNHALRSTALSGLLDDVGSLPPFCNRDALAGASHFWFGPAGTVTPLHHDTLMILHMHVVGRKRWRLVSPLYTPWLYNHEGVFSRVDLDAPDYERFPLLRKVQVHEVVVEPGETLFIPLGWWHQVSALDTCLSLSLTGFDFPNEFSYAMPALTHW